MPDAISERLALELQLLEAMYPEQLRFDRNARDLSFSSGIAGSADRLVLRLPNAYPVVGRPEVVAARGRGGGDARGRVQGIVSEVCEQQQQQQQGGEDEEEAGGGGEVLDAVLAAFLEVVEAEDERGDTSGRVGVETPVGASEVKTVVVWLHHLLATSKRKLAINPSSSQGAVRGVTKPGYPGVLVFSGQRAAVEDHVAELKGLNWQAFAVRYEADERWEFGKGVKEVETMAEMVQCIEEGRREAFLQAVGVK